MDERYSRQKRFKPIGEQGQRLLEQATVAIIGCGALGSAIAETLVRAGVGHLRLVDRDIVEFSNLQRQQLYSERHAAEMLPKAAAAEQRLRDIRSDVQLSVYMEHADSLLIEQLAGESDLIMDATDNFETRFIINDAAYKHGIPWIYGACIGAAGVAHVFVPAASACLRCLLPLLPSLNDSCETAGIIGPAVQFTASLQCAEALKWLTGNRQSINRKVQHFDLWGNSRLEVGISRIKQEDCPTCGIHPNYPSLHAAEDTRIAVLCGRDTVQIKPGRRRGITLEEAERVGHLARAEVRRTPFFVQIKLGEHRIMIFENGRMLIHGLSDIEQGRKVYHQLFG